MSRRHLAMMVTIALLAACSTIGQITTAAVEAAPAKAANYAYVIVPSSFGPPGLNLNGFRDVYVAYYRCENLPAPKG